MPYLLSHTIHKVISGDLMSVRFKYRDASDPDRLANRMHIVLHTDNIMQIHLTGVTIYD